jgi:hypothetical protein
MLLSLYRITYLSSETDQVFMAFMVRTSLCQNSSMYPKLVYREDDYNGNYHRQFGEVS